MRHNKKRNVALIYEQLIRYISRAVIEENHDKAKIASDIIKEYFVKGTHLYREFRLFNAIMRTTASSETVAEKIISEAKSAAKDHDAKALDIEKSKLISAINKRLDDNSFYAIRIPEYRSFATVQVLLNAWRDKSSDISLVVECEEKAKKILLESKSQDKFEVNTEVNPLSVRILSEKVSNKLSASLDKRQLDIVMSHVKQDGNLTNILSETKKASLDSLKKVPSIDESGVLSESVGSVRAIIEQLDPTDHSDESISKFLVAHRLVNEIDGEKND